MGKDGILWEGPHMEVGQTSHKEVAEMKYCGLTVASIPCSPALLGGRKVALVCL